MNQTNFKQITERLRKETTWLDIQKVEERFKAHYVGNFAAPLKSGVRTHEAYPVFYNPNPDESKGHKHYFLLVRNGLNLMISDATFVDGAPISAVVADDGEIIYSSAVHDYRLSTDETAMIDGGFDYCRYTAKNRPITITVKDGEFCMWKEPQ